MVSFEHLHVLYMLSLDYANILVAVVTAPQPCRHWTPTPGLCRSHKSVTNAIHSTAYQDQTCPNGGHVDTHTHTHTRTHLSGLLMPRFFKRITIFFNKTCEVVFIEMRKNLELKVLSAMLSSANCNTPRLSTAC